MFNVSLPILISRIITLIVAFTVHEFAHAWTADLFGDDTPRYQGRLTLNPLSHLDPLGSIMLIAVGFGWAKPVVVNFHTLERRTPLAPMLVALAGPVSNLLLAVAAAIPVQAGLVNIFSAGGPILPSAGQFVQEFVTINLLLMVFNLIPLAPLDGEKVLYYFLPAEGKGLMDRLRPYGPMILLALIFLAPFLGLDIIGTILYPPIRVLLRLLLV